MVQRSKKILAANTLNSATIWDGRSRTKVHTSAPLLHGRLSVLHFLQYAAQMLAFCLMSQVHQHFHQMNGESVLLGFFAPALPST